MKVESDSLVAVKLIESQDGNFSSTSPLLKGIRKLINMEWTVNM